MIINSHDEDDQQAAVIQWASYFPALKWLHSIPNGAYLAGTKIERAKRMQRMKRQGLKVGVFDLFLPKARNGYHGLYIEMKNGRGTGVVSSDQKDFGKDVSCDGYLCVICNGAAEAIQEIKTYMGM